MKQLWINGEYVDVTDEIYTAYLKGQRKINYFEKDLKSERVIKDKNGDIKKIIPIREDSLDRLLSDNQRQFSDDSESVETVVETNDEIDKLHNALNQLSADKWAIIKMLFYDEMSERDNVKQITEKESQLNNKKTDMKKIDFYYEQFISWADEFDNASQERKRMIICTLFKEITVGKGYKIEILMDSSYEQFLR